MQIRSHIKLYTSTKAALLEDKLEKEIQELEENGFVIESITSNISYAGDKGYMILAQIKYCEEVTNDIKMFDAGIDFSANMSVDCPSSICEA